MTTFWNAFGEIAARYPDQPAIVDRGRTVCYRELCARAAGVGERLKAQGAGPETPVGLRMEKSAEYIIGLLGCWHAGAAFVPLPPSLPQERQDYIISEAEIRHFLAAEDIRNTSEAAVAPAAVKSDTLAYIIYTSGSTGKPKGVMVEHRGIVNLCTAQRAAFGMKAGSRSLFYLSINFDASVSDIGVALLSGAALVIRTPEELRDGAALKRVLREETITHMDVPPSLLKILSPDEMPPSLETIIIGGEAAAAETVRQWAARFRVVNVYGPTEATVCTSLNICGTDWDRPLLGQPLPEVDYLVLDGELHIGGNMLARGYLKQPELTAQKFIVRDGQRLYRTGDRVAAHADHSLEFLGRIDRQFKLRGQLVEPDEIEARLRAHPKVMKAAVLKREERLVAFVALSEASAVLELPAWVAKALPGWMIPQRFETVARLPLTASGKTDYAALARMPLQGETAERQPPRNPAEEKLWNIWHAVLKHGDFGVADAFYASGGDSLGIIRLTLEAERQGLIVSPGLFTAHPTIEEQAKYIAAATSSVAADWLREDVAFDAEMRSLFAAARERGAAPPAGNILLTGATGFLGSRVLCELLNRTDATIYCIIRAGDAKAAEERIRETVGKYNVPLSSSAWSRVVALPGDLSRPQGDLDDGIWNFLSHNIDAIYHCAACVNMVLSYADMRAMNVGAARELLKLACNGRRKTFHNASTLSVFVATDQNKGTLLESDRLENVKNVFGGYAQTKFAAEHMLAQVPSEVCPVYQYRFGLLTGAVDSGASSATDFLAMFARGITRLGAVPAGFADRLKVDITPICHAARAMVVLSQKAPAATYHIANGDALSLGRFCDALSRRGYAMREIGSAAWRELVRRKPLTPEETAAVLSLCRVAPEEFDKHRTMDLFQATDVSFDMRAAEAVLQPAGIECPPVTDGLIRTYLDWFFRNDKRPLKICLFGPESTGKSTLAKNLAASFGTAFAAEYAHEHISARDGEIALADISQIAAGQVQAERRAEAEARNVLFCDTDLLTTTIWSDRLFGECPGWIRTAAELQHYDLYLLMDVDAPWVDDIHRYLPEERQSFLDSCRNALESRGRPYIMLSGSWDGKFSAACAAVTRLLNKGQEKAA